MKKILVLYMFSHARRYRLLDIISYVPKQKNCVSGVKISKSWKSCVLQGHCMVTAITLAICKGMQSSMTDRLIFVLVRDHRFSYAMLAVIQASLMNPALSSKQL